MTGMIIYEGEWHEAEIIRQASYANILKKDSKYFVRWETAYATNQEEFDTLEEAISMWEDYVDGESCIATGAKPGDEEDNSPVTKDDLIWAFDFFFNYSKEVAEELIAKHIDIFEVNMNDESAESIARDIIEAEEQQIDLDDLGE